MGKRKLDKTASSDLVSPNPACEQTISRIITRKVARELGFEVPSLRWFDTFRCHKQSKRGGKTKPTNSKKKKMDTNMFESYLEHLWRNISEDKRSSCTYLDCLWFSLYKKGSDKTKVLMWIRRKDIFSRTYVFVPIVCWHHWSLLILCHFGGDMQSKTRTPCMLLLDSLEMANPKRLEPYIRKFVLDIYRSEGREEREKLISRIPLLVPKVPQQRNGEECGVFVLYFIKLFLQSAPENFSIFDGYPYFMKENWFDFKGLEKFRRQIYPCGW
ncbi:probable ubiquitin-like-specific protease 2A isoform X2 [Magnolia sinica]|uniref:probable ubiquitin-like-specific protease 2A isoform X2 n=1 Tax=Magnolia sinica TaxID=86752 RepID=UPI00265A714E|nr:probable ubiquitin-like-specific protease 2A isoform X2 [Magnolia sinica]